MTLAETLPVSQFLSTERGCRALSELDHEQGVDLLTGLHWDCCESSQEMRQSCSGATLNVRIYRERGESEVVDLFMPQFRTGAPAGFSLEQSTAASQDEGAEQRLQHTGRGVTRGDGKSWQEDGIGRKRPPEVLEKVLMLWPWAG